MLHRYRVVCATGAAVCLLVGAAATSRSTLAQARHGAVRIAAASATQVRDWDARVDRMLRAGELRVRSTRQDTLMPRRTHERADQYYRGVRVYGGDVTRQLENGTT